MNNQLKILSETIVQKIMNTGDYKENLDYVEAELNRFRQTILDETNRTDESKEQRRDAVKDDNRIPAILSPESVFTPEDKIGENYQ